MVIRKLQNTQEGYIAKVIQESNNSADLSIQSSETKLGHELYGVWCMEYILS